MTKEVSKIEDSESYHKILNPKYSGKSKELRVVDVSKEKGIKALYSVDQKMVKKYLFDVTEWTLNEAEEWVQEHQKDSSRLSVMAKIKRDGKKLQAIASTDIEDRDGEVLSVEGWELENYKKNSVLLWMHNQNPAHNGLPVGRANKIGYKTISGKKCLVFEPELDDSTEFNRALKKMILNGLVNTCSVGFLPTEKEDNIYTKQELLEISFVPVPANHQAEFIRQSKGLGFNKKKAIEFVDLKSVVPYRATPPAPESQAWNAPEATVKVRRWAGGPDKDEIEFSRYKQAFTWYDSADEVNFGAYKLPHHNIVGGKLVTVWRGVAAAMAALLGARGGVDVPTEDRRKIYNHLAKHYKQYDKDVPDFKLVESQELKELFDIYTDEVLRKGYQEFKKNNRDIKKFVKEVQRERREERDNRINESKLVVSSILSGVDKAITKSLGGDKSQMKGGK